MLILRNLKNPEIAYFAGVVQSDGKFSVYGVKKHGKTYKRADFGIRTRALSLPMTEKFCEILEKYFIRRISITKTRRGEFDAHTSINKLIKIFEKLEILPKELIIPSWTENNIRLFGPYLAGLIDGDGNIRIKRPKYPQCAIRIISEENPKKLKMLIIKLLKCGAHFARYRRESVIDGRMIIGNYYVLEFYATKKNVININKYILPYLSIRHKKDLLENFASNCLGSIDSSAGTMVSK
jgi:hypothetical protein